MSIAIGLCIGPSGKYEQYAAPSIAAVHPEAPIYERRDQRSIFEAYNSIIDEHRSARPENPLILIHEDVELLERLDRIEQMLEPDVAIIGTIGGRGVQSVRWFRAAERFGRAPDTVNGDNHHSDGEHDVDIVDGLFLALSPWATKHLRFDEDSFTGFHGYDADICMQARAAGKRVRVTNIDLFHHSKGGFGDAANHRSVDDTFRKKWNVPLDPFLHRIHKQVRNRAY